MEKENIIEIYGNKFCDILNNARFTSLGKCIAEELKKFAKDCFKLGEEFGEKNNMEKENNENR